MRILIACLLFFSVNFSSAYALKADIKTVVHYGAEKLSPSFKKAQISARSQKNALTEEQFASNVERITPNSLSYTFVSLFCELNGYSNLNLVAYSLSPRFKRDNIYSYQFIFNCLYPKHTFW